MGVKILNNGVEDEAITASDFGNDEFSGNPVNEQLARFFKPRPRALESLPEANAVILGECVFLIGTQTPYVKGHLYRCVSSTETVDGEEITTYSWEDQNIGRFGVGNCSDILCIRVSRSTSASLRWTSPNDIISAEGNVLVAWAKDVVVRNPDHIPTSIDDGTVVLTSTTRNAYKHDWFVDSGLAADHDTYYYKIFPVTTEGYITNDNANSCYTDILTWSTISSLISAGEHRNYIHIGDIISLPQHDTYGDIEAEVVGYEDSVNLHDKNIQHAIVLRTRFLLTGGKQFDTPEKYAVLTKDTTFQSGKKYGIHFVKTTDTEAVDGKTYYQLNADWTVTALSVNVGDALSTDCYVAGTSAAPAQYTVITVTAGASIPADTWYEINVDANRNSYGCNRWDQSGVRKYLNATKAGSMWWTPSTIFDAIPAYAGTVGFLGGFHNNEFLSMIKEVDNICQLPNADGGGSVVCTDKVWLPSKWQLGDTSNDNLLEHSDPCLEAFINITNENRRRRYKTNTTGYDHHWTRSAATGYSCYVWYVNTSGGFTNLGGAYNQLGFAPCLVIAAQ